MYKKILSLIKSHKNIFITGAAGTGKSFILNKLQQDFSDMCVTASTGVAAINVSGTTIHSFAGFGFGTKTANQIAHSIHRRQRIKIIQCTLLAIDEISMLSAETFDLINNVFKIIRNNTHPFGGIQIIVIGDFLQLPPVSDNNQEVKFAFESIAWEEAKFVTINLEKQYRQDDTTFLSDLNKIRFGEAVSFHSSTCHDNALQLFALNRTANDYNKAKLKEINADLHHFKAYDSGDEKSIATIDRNCLVPKDLYLKVGARVMLLINKWIEISLINGSMGTITDIFHNTVTVKFDNGVSLGLSYETVAKIMEKKIELASRSQIPLRLAYAISIHKAQGLTLDKVVVDFEGTFACGQAYVALSRVRSRDALSIKNLDHTMIKANEKAIAFYKGVK